MEGCIAAVMDFDGVLARTSTLGAVEPRGLGFEVARSLASAGLKLYVVTGRGPRDRGLVASLLRRGGFPLARLGGIMVNELGVGEVEWKLEAAMEIAGREGCVAEVHDDNEYVLGSLRRLAGGGVLHWDDKCSVVYGVSRAPQCSRSP